MTKPIISGLVALTMSMSVMAKDVPSYMEVRDAVEKIGCTMGSEEQYNRIFAEINSHSTADLVNQSKSGEEYTFPDSSNDTYTRLDRNYHLRSDLRVLVAELYILVNTTEKDRGVLYYARLAANKHSINTLPFGAICNVND